MPLTGLTPILNVSDIGASLAWFTALGWRRGFTCNDTGMIPDAADANEAGPAGFGSVSCGDCEIFLCRGAQGSRGGPLPQHAGDDNTGGVWMSWWFAKPAEVDELHKLALEKNFTVTWPPTDEPWGVREFHLRHPDGHTIRVSAPTCAE